MNEMEPGAAAPESGGKGPWWKRKWVIGVAAGFLGIGIGGAFGATPVEDTPEYKELSSEVLKMKTDLRVAEGKADRVDEVDTIAASNDIRTSELDGRERDLDDVEAALVKREKAVGIKEKEIESNTISGDGTYKVGEDIKAGTYKSGPPASGNCYWQISPDPNGDDIINNNNSSGQSRVSVSKGQYLMLSGCDEFVKQ
jgi:hypothetical protein